MLCIPIFENNMYLLAVAKQNCVRANFYMMLF